MQHNGVITDYNLTCTVGGMISSNRVNDTSFVILVDPFTNYSCTVRAATAIGDGPATAVMSGVTDEDSECFTIAHNESLFHFGLQYMYASSVCQYRA